MNKKSSGIGTALILVVFGVLMSYLFIYKPPIKSKEKANAEIEKLTKQLNETKTVKRDSDQETQQIAAKVAKTGMPEIMKAVSGAGIPSSAVTKTEKTVKIRYSASPDVVAAAISDLVGDPYIDREGQIRGHGPVFKAQLEVKSSGSTPILIATLSPP